MNTDVLKTTFASLGVACIVQFFLHQIQSEFVFGFLKSNITNLQVALLAVNTATLGIVLTKIREIIDKTGQRAAFDSTRGEMLLSIKEQVTLIAVSLLILALEAAKSLPMTVSSEIFQAALMASFIYSIIVLYDTAKSVFVILDY
ncbi:MAG: hypothetical protein V4627_16475 [Pseudomonadota bacterium]